MCLLTERSTFTCHLHVYPHTEQVCVQLPTYADNVALPTFTCHCYCVLGSYRSTSPASGARSRKPAAVDLLLWESAGTDRQTSYCYIDAVTVSHTQDFKGAKRATKQHSTRTQISELDETLHLQRTCFPAVCCRWSWPPDTSPSLSPPTAACSGLYFLQSTDIVSFLPLS